MGRLRCYFQRFQHVHRCTLLCPLRGCLTLPKRPDIPVPPQITWVCTNLTIPVTGRWSSTPMLSKTAMGTARTLRTSAAGRPVYLTLPRLRGSGDHSWAIGKRQPRCYTTTHFSFFLADTSLPRTHLGLSTGGTSFGLTRLLTRR